MNRGALPGGAIAAGLALGSMIAGCVATTPTPSGARSPPVASAIEHPVPAAVLLGRDLSLHSNGAARDETWQLTASGYVAAYLQLDEEGPVRVSVEAASQTPVEPVRLALVLGDVSRSFDATAAGATQFLETTLAPGTYLVRVDYQSGDRANARGALVRHIGVDGARLLGEHSDQNALDAANTYIHYYRRGPAKVRLLGVGRGAPVKVSLVRHAFAFGKQIAPDDPLLAPASPRPVAGPARSLQYFNTLVLSRGADWLDQEAVRDEVHLETLDRFLELAEERGLEARLDALLSDTERQPTWVDSRDPNARGLLTLAAAGDANAKRELLQQIDERIQAVVSQRARRYQALGVLAESQHPGRFWQVLGDSGTADLFVRVKRALAGGGGSARLYLDESDLLQRSQSPGEPRAPADPYGNWYRWRAEAILRAGGPVDGLGIRYHADARPLSALGNQVHSAARIMGVLQNLAGTGLELTLSEFAVDRGALTPERGADVLEETLRLVFGTARSEAFLLGMAEPQARATSTESRLSELRDREDPRNAPQRRYEALMQEWATELELPVGADGRIEFSGFYGDYALAVAGQTLCFTLIKGRSEYDLEVSSGSAASGGEAGGGRPRCGTKV
jgi:hypothetical protein